MSIIIIHLMIALVWGIDILMLKISINAVFQFWYCQKSEYVFVTTPALRGKPQVDIPIKDALINNLVTIEEAQKRGLKCNVINKEEEAKKNNIN